VKHFATALQRGGYEVIKIEQSVEGADVDGVPLKGSIDCVLADGDGEAIVDFKFGGATAFQKKLESGRALQLATYGHARQAPIKGAAYFILAQNRLITTRAGAMREASHEVEGPSVETTWQRLHEALQTAGGWMQTGQVPARPLQDPAEWDLGTTVGLDPDEPDGPCRFCDYDVLCGRRPLQ